MSTKHKAPQGATMHRREFEGGWDSLGKEPKKKGNRCLPIPFCDSVGNIKIPHIWEFSRFFLFSTK